MSVLRKYRKHPAHISDDEWNLAMVRVQLGKNPKAIARGLGVSLHRMAENFEQRGYKLPAGKKFKMQERAFYKKLQQAVRGALEFHGGKRVAIRTQVAPRQTVRSYTISWELDAEQILLAALYLARGQDLGQAYLDAMQSDAATWWTGGVGIGEDDTAKRPAVDSGGAKE